MNRNDDIPDPSDPGAGFRRFIALDAEERANPQTECEYRHFLHEMANSEVGRVRDGDNPFRVFSRMIVLAISKTRSSKLLKGIFKQIAREEQKSREAKKLTFVKLLGIELKGHKANPPPLEHRPAIQPNAPSYC